MATSFAARPSTPVPPWVVALLALGNAPVAAETRARGLDAGAGVDDRGAGGESRDGRWGNGASYDGKASGSTQFLSRDPAVAVTREPYAYVADNPLNATDPSGLDPRMFEGLSEALQSQYEFTEYGVQAFAKRGLNQVWADKVIGNALKTYSIADGSTVSVAQYAPGRFGLVVRNAAGKVYNGYRGLRLNDICRMARSFGYQDFDRSELDNAAQIEVAEEAQAEAPPDPAPAEGGDMMFAPGNFGGGGHDDDE